MPPKSTSRGLVFGARSSERSKPGEERRKSAQAARRASSKKQSTQFGRSVGRKKK